MKFVVMQVLSTIILGVWPSVKGFFEKYRRLALLLFILSIALMIVVIFSGCSMLPVKSPEEMAKHTYRKELVFEVDGKKYAGIGVLPHKAFYDITFFPEAKVDSYIIQTCHRDVLIRKPKTGWFSNKYTYRYQPQVGLETKSTCALEVAALNESQKNEGFAFITYQDERPEISLKANMRCNGLFSNEQGVAICQTAAGLLQQVFFMQQVLIENVGGPCEMPTSDDGFFWNLKVSKDECTYFFTGREKHKNGKRLSFGLTTIGYTSIKE